MTTDWKRLQDAGRARVLSKHADYRQPVSLDDPYFGQRDPMIAVDPFEFDNLRSLAQAVADFECDVHNAYGENPDDPTDTVHWRGGYARLVSAKMWYEAQMADMVDAEEWREVRKQAREVFHPR